MPPRQQFSLEIRRALIADDELTFAEACRLANIGPGDCSSRSRSPAHVAARDTVVFVLLRTGWTQERVAVVTRRSVRQIKRISKKLGVMSPFRVT